MGHRSYIIKRATRELRLINHPCQQPDSSVPLWLHRLALLTVCLAVLALASGAVVTTFRVGMADPLWPTYPWHLALISWHEPSAGFIVEHTHRLFDYLLGFCCILLAAGLW